MSNDPQSVLEKNKSAEDTLPDLLYTQTHEWVRLDNETTATIGITDHAQQMLGDIVFVDLPSINDTTNVGDDIAVIESVKTAADIYSPLSGNILAINDTLTNNPETVNQDPYEGGWLYKISISDPTECQRLLSAADYTATIDEK